MLEKSKGNGTYSQFQFRPKPYKQKEFKYHYTAFTSMLISMATNIREQARKLRGQQQS